MKKKLKKHEGLITVFGALIVFATFVVKDAIRDKYKDWADSIDNAEVHYKIAADLMTLHKDLRKNLDATRELRNEVQGKHKNKDISFNVVELELEQRELSDAGAEIENISILVRKLAKHDDEQKTIDHLRDDMGLVRDFIKDKDVLNYEENTGEKLNPNDKTDWNKRVALDFARIAAERVKDNGAFGADLLKELEEKTVARAKQERDRYKNLDESFTGWSYVLFAFGWGVGVLGKWAGIKDGNDSE